MKSILKNIIAIIVFGCYLQAVLEISFGAIQNTFGDEYDTYVQSDNQATVHIQKVKHFNDIDVTPDFSFDYHTTALLTSIPCISSGTDFTLQTKRYITFRSLII